MYVIRTDERYCYGPVWSPVAGRWSRIVVYYPRETIGKKIPMCARPLGAPALNRLVDGTAKARELRVK
jgi:hypothetical protein